MKYVQRVETIVLLLVCGGVAGCFSARTQDIEAFMKPSQTEVTTDQYLLQPPDEIEVHCVKVPEIHLHRQAIRPDGIISFETLGEIKAAGKTPGDVAKILEERVTELYTLPGEQPVDVRIAVFRSKVYYIIGEVTNPGSKPYTGRDQVFRAVCDANPLVTAWKDHIQVIRPSIDKNTKPKVFEVSFNRMGMHGDLSKNVMLEEGDVVYVPPTVLASIAMVIEEFVRPIGRALAPAITVQRMASPTGY